MRTPTASTSVLGLSSPQLQPYQELCNMPPSYVYSQQQQPHHHHTTFDTKNNPMMELNSNLHARKHSLSQGRYHKKVHGKDYGRKRNEYDEKFVSEMSGNEKELDDTDQAGTIDDSSFECDDSAKLEANFSCELTEFEKQILSKYLTEYSDEGNSTDDLDLVTKCDEEITHDDQPVILPTTIAALEIVKQDNEKSFISDECASSSFNSDELMQEEFVVNNDEIQQFAKEYQIGTTLLLKTSDNNNEFNNNIINNNDNDFGLSASIDSSSVIMLSSSSSSLHPHQDQSPHHHSKSSLTNVLRATEKQDEDINNNNSCYDKNLKDNKISRTNSTGSERDNSKNKKSTTSSNYSSNRLGVILRNNYPIWIGITSCVWGLIIYLMKSYT